MFFIEHIKEHHEDVTGEKLNCNKVMSSSGISKNGTTQIIPHKDVIFLNVTFVPFLAPASLV